MLVDPIKLVNGVDDSTGYSVAVNAKTIRGFQGNPFVITEDQKLERETYELQTMIDPGDPDKKRETLFIWPEGVFSGYSYVQIIPFKELIFKNFSNKHHIIFGSNRLDPKSGEQEDHIIPFFAQARKQIMVSILFGT